MTLPLPPTLSRDVDPTTAATEFYKALVAYNKTHGTYPAVYNLGQGIEPQIPEGRLKEIMTEPRAGTLNGFYAFSGGVQDQRIVAASWVNRFYNVPATWENTLIYPTHGRSHLDRLFLNTHFAQQKLDRSQQGLVVLENNHWAMLDSQISENDLEKVEYNSYNWFEGLQTIDQQALQTNRSMLVYDANVTNPLSMHKNQRWYHPLFQTLEAANSVREQQKSPLVSAVIDMPYSMAREQRTIEQGSYFDAGLDSVLKKSIITPYYIVISFSKMIGDATNGFSIVVTHPKYTESYRGKNHRGQMSASNATHVSRYMDLMQPENDQLLLTHCDTLRQKYKENGDMLTHTIKEINHPHIRVLHGGVGMTKPVQFEQELFQGQKIQSERFDGLTYQINDMHDFVEYLGLEHGVVCVKQADNMGRFALAPQTAQFKESMTPLTKGITQIANLVNA
jgi:hypothetical protein